jgi:hypothetical protein
MFLLITPVFNALVHTKCANLIGRLKIMIKNGPQRLEQTSTERDAIPVFVGRPQLEPSPDHKQIATK